MGSMSPMHWVIVLIIVLLVFGPTRLASLDPQGGAQAT